jgi:hypothetical protein
MGDLLFLPFLAALVVYILWLSAWAIADAKLRGKSSWLVLMAVLLFFPWGLLAWLLFRPEPIEPNRPSPLFVLKTIESSSNPRSPPRAAESTFPITAFTRS